MLVLAITNKRREPPSPEPIVGSGELLAGDAEVVGVGDVFDVNTGALQADPAVVTGAGATSSTGTGSLEADASVVDGAGTVPVNYTTWNPSDKSANIALSNGDRTATASGPGDIGVRGKDVKTTGKWYIEYAYTNSTNSDDAVGLAKGTANLGTIGFVTDDAVMHFRSGTVVNDTASLFNNGGFAGGGNIVSVAYDADNGRVWTRLDGGNWNASGTADPATNTGGIDVSAFDGSGLFPCMTAGNTGSVCTMNPGSSAFAHSVPAGFTGWTE